MIIMHWTWYFYVSVIFTSLLQSLYCIELSEMNSYAKVSKNGAVISEARNFHATPIYIPSKLPKIRKGETIDYPSMQKYSTLDTEMIAKLDAETVRQQAQDRFHPPASFEHVIAHSNAHRQQNAPDSSASLNSVSSSSASQSSGGSTSDSYITLPHHVYDTYNNHPPNLKPSKDSLPLIIDDYSPSVHTDDSYSKIPNSYEQQNTYGDIPKSPSYIDNFSSKPIDYSDTHHHSTYIDDTHLNENDHDHHYPYELIYDHPPDHIHHDYTTTTTEQSEMNDQRLSKRPYSYYYIGKKLWYLPLYFSIYFIIYIAALVLKSIARHKINFPSNLAEAAANARNSHDNYYYNGPGFWNKTQHILNAIDKFSNDNTTTFMNMKS